MHRILSIGVFFLLAMAMRAVGSPPLYTLISAEIQLPEGVQGRPIWFADRLADGRLAVGYEGGAAAGLPGGPWQIWATPEGQAVTVIRARGNSLLAAGFGLVAFLEPDGMRPLDIEVDRFVSIEPVPEGWLIGTAHGLKAFDAEGEPLGVTWTGAPLRDVRVVQRGTETWITAEHARPMHWTGLDLDRSPRLERMPTKPIYFAADDYFATSRGVWRNGERFIENDHLVSALFNAGLVGLGTTTESVAIGTLSAGLVGFDKTTQTERWRWQTDSNLYSVNTTQDALLAGTGNGLHVLHASEQFLTRRVKESPVLGLVVSASNDLHLVQTSGTLDLGGHESDPSRYWPTRREASVAEGKLTLGEATAPLGNRFVTGLGVVGDTVAVCHAQGVDLLSRDGTARRLTVEGSARNLVSDGRHFHVGTHHRGIQVLDTTGAVVRQIGDGRASAVETRPGEVALVFWRGDLLTPGGRPLGRVPVGHPTDAAALPQGLAVLVQRPDQDPLIGLLDGDRWEPLDIPGLAQVGAHDIAASREHLYIAGPRGVIRAELPLPRARPPRLTTTWSAPVAEETVRLPRDRGDRVHLTVGPVELPPAPATRVRVRLGDSAWIDARPGGPVPLYVGWGGTRVEIEAERLGLTTTQVFQIIRPYPWWLRNWAWPLHAATLTTLVLLLVRARTRRLQRRNVELERRVAARTAALRKANAAKEEFLAGISHEIRNPLNGVVGICAILADREVGPREQMLVRTLGGCADQLRSMLDDILDFSRIERGEITLSNTTFDLIALIEESAQVMDPELRSCSLLLPAGPIWLHGDSGKFRQILCNLISNALKYGRPPEAGIEARVERADGGRVRARLAVRNTGPTIPPEELPRLFESFRRGSGSGHQTGSGLGLAVCRRLVQAMGGRITAASTEGQTEFAVEITLPAALPPRIETELPATVSRALAVEDEAYNRIALGHVLRQMGYAVDWAEDAAVALKLAASKPYDLILTDWRLPDMTGDVLCRKLRQRQPAPPPPVIAVTAYSADEKLPEAIAAGMAGYVTKPVTREKLEGVIRALASGLRPRRSLDTRMLAAATPGSPLAALGELAPSARQLAADIIARWTETEELARMGDPRAERAAHALLTLLRIAGEDTAAEQAELLEKALHQRDHAGGRELLPFVGEEVSAAVTRLRAV
jgi:signal transduction histidine kinase/DNA-binding response OmpR family regulator